MRELTALPRPSSWFKGDLLLRGGEGRGERRGRRGREGIFKMIATSGFLTALECTKFVLGRAPPRTPLGELTALPQTP